MRIVFVVQALGVGGVERQFIQLSEGLLARGHDVRICALHTFSQGWRWMQRAEGLPVRHLYDRKPSNIVGSVLQYVGAIRDLRRTFSAHEIEVAHAANTGLTGSLLWFATLGRRRPLTVWGQRGGQGVSRETGRALHHSLATRFCRGVSRGTSALVSNSEAGREALQRDGFRCRTFPVVANGIDTGKFQREEEAGRKVRKSWGVDDSCRLVGMVARPVPVKGPDLFLRAASLLAEHDAAYASSWSGVETPPRGFVTGN
jgi:glycosyltransferase involved in cell wall biosynthesis